MRLWPAEWRRVLPALGPLSAGRKAGRTSSWLAAGLRVVRAMQRECEGSEFRCEGLIFVPGLPGKGRGSHSTPFAPRMLRGEFARSCGGIASRRAHRRRIPIISTLLPIHLEAYDLHCPRPTLAPDVSSILLPPTLIQAPPSATSPPSTRRPSDLNDITASSSSRSLPRGVASIRRTADYGIVSAAVTNVFENT
ncbi:uncharacterized protein C8Q71DRAFT_250934 [Rhodofomes roseus]|uniref:Uncharacterized protein n=1 Tax=Rhodofomes roseus TaxID=34475 RepID=A0ABQ8K772_9APHY|nr:uncharacterized protein C8Q71DRAFT_250934 [Rhodofomes roseus]KAH9833048.1 hypothetical protein C8Q71DRAFT_250934 [Rhodofomes roseus]